MRTGGGVVLPNSSHYRRESSETSPSPWQLPGAMVPLAQVLGSGEWEGESEGWAQPAFSCPAYSWGRVVRGPPPRSGVGPPGAVLVLDPLWTRGASTPSPFLIAALILISESPFDEVLFPVCTPLLTGLFLLSLYSCPGSEETLRAAVGRVRILLQAQPLLKLKLLL